VNPLGHFCKLCGTSFKDAVDPMSAIRARIRRGIGLARVALNVVCACAAIALITVVSIIGLVLNAVLVHHTERYFAGLALLGAIGLAVLNDKRETFQNILDSLENAVGSGEHRANRLGSRVSSDSSSNDGPTRDAAGSTQSAPALRGSSVQFILDSALDTFLGPLQTGVIAVPSVLSLVSVLLLWTGHTSLGVFTITLTLFTLAVGLLVFCTMKSFLRYHVDRIREQLDRVQIGGDPVEANEGTALL
jgi:uncharacterized membrane protein